MTILRELHEAILRGDTEGTVRLTRAALDEGSDPGEMLTRHMIPALDEIGRRFECSEIYIPELLLAGRAMKSALALVRPVLAGAAARTAGRVIIGTVKGDLHDIGKNIVASMLEGAGFEVVDLGVNVSSEQFVEAVSSRKADVLAVSALLTTTMLSMRGTIEALNSAGLRDRVKVMIGGAPTTREFADEIRADGWSPNANGAVSLARGWVGAVDSARQ